MRTWVKVLVTLTALSAAAAAWRYLPFSFEEEDRTALLCQWSVSDSKSGVSIITEDVPSEMTMQELLESGLAFSVEHRKVLQCQPAGLPPVETAPPNSSTGTLVLNEQ